MSWVRKPCPNTPSGRHRWAEVKPAAHMPHRTPIDGSPAAMVLDGLTSRERLLSHRVCGKCGASGTLDAQGIVRANAAPIAASVSAGDRD